MSMTIDKAEALLSILKASGEYSRAQPLSTTATKETYDFLFFRANKMNIARKNKLWF